jgi:ribosomal protein L33
MNDSTLLEQQLQSSFYQLVKNKRTHEALSIFQNSNNRDALLNEVDPIDKFTPLHWATQNQDVKLVLELTKFCTSSRKRPLILH